MSLTLPPYGADDERELRSHLRLLHGLYVTDEHNPDGLVTCHTDDHAEGFGFRPVRHTHTAAPEPDALEEWSWEWPTAT